MTSTPHYDEANLLQSTVGMASLHRSSISFSISSCAFRVYCSHSSTDQSIVQFASFSRTKGNFIFHSRPLRRPGKWFPVPHSSHPKIVINCSQSWHLKKLPSQRKIPRTWKKRRRLPLEPNHYGEGGGNNEQISNMLLSYYVERPYSCLLRWGRS